MSAVQNIISDYQLLMQHTFDPAAVNLALAMSTLDPLNLFYKQDWLTEAEGPDPVLVLLIARHAFPDIYVTICEKLRYKTDLDTVACRAADLISEAMGGLETYGWEGFYWGIPLPAYGVDWAEPETNEKYACLLAAFGYTDAMSIEQLDFHIVRLLVDSLPPETVWRQVGRLLDHFFSLSGNSCIDLNWDAISELYPLTWTPEDIAFAQAILREANDILVQAARGLAALENDHIFRALRNNIHWLRQKLTTITNNHLEDTRDLTRYLAQHPINIEWPTAA